jgi:glyoxylase-like metal-dependent hydrolase (beta-lactamase superfamily II)
MSPSSAPRRRTIGQAADLAAVRSLTYDDVTVTYVVDGVIAIRPEVFFPAIPDDAWSQLRAANGTLLMSAGGLLVETAGPTVLIDTGVGEMTADLSFGEIDCGAMLDVLDALGTRRTDIDAVAFTHLHFDHAGWTFINGTKTFPDARHVVAADELDPYRVARQGTDPTTPWHVISRLVGADTGVESIEDGDEIVPGVHAMVTGGHTPGHTSYVVTSSAGRRLVVFGDAFHTPVQITHPDWVSVADSDTDDVIRARRRLLGELHRPDTLGFAFHFGDQPFGRAVVDEAGTAVWDPVPSWVLAPAPRQRSPFTAAARPAIHRGSTPKPR